MTLKEINTYLSSCDHAERLVGEYWETCNRYVKLYATINRIKTDAEYNPIVPLEIYQRQADAMNIYLQCLLQRMGIEGISIDGSV